MCLLQEQDGGNTGLQAAQRQFSLYEALRPLESKNLNTFRTFEGMTLSFIFKWAGSTITSNENVRSVNLSEKTYSNLEQKCFPITFFATLHTGLPK